MTQLQLVSFETFLFIGVKILYKIQLGRVKVHVKSNYMSITGSDTKHRTLTVSNILQKHKIYQWFGCTKLREIRSEDIIYNQ